MADPDAHIAGRFAPGDHVTVHDRFGPGHVRTPHYCRGQSGTIERVCGHFRNPEELAYGQGDVRPQTLYRVRFRQTDLWPDYAGAGTDTVEIEIYDHWLDPAP